MLSNEAVRQVYKSAQQQQLLQLQLKDLGGPALLDRLNRKSASNKTQAEEAVWAWLRKRKRKCCSFRSPRRNDGSWNRDSDVGTSDVDSSDSSDDQSVLEAEELRETTQSHQSTRGNEAESTYRQQIPMLYASAGVHQSTCPEKHISP